MHSVVAVAMNSLTILVQHFLSEMGMIPSTLVLNHLMDATFTILYRSMMDECN